MLGLNDPHTQVKQDGNDYLTKSDFRPLLEAILERHPGLDFLKTTQEFQEKYADTVIARIFFVHNLKDDGKIRQHGHCVPINM